MIEVELAGLEVFGHHGADEEERARGQRFVFDLRWSAPETAVSDRLEDTIDYREVAACVREVSNSKRFTLIEALASAVADAILERFAVTTVSVRVRKPHLNLPVRHSAATVTRTR
jgi:7,8-dihydroneopterin aldolase/epimerase/oxygenase